MSEDSELLHRMRDPEDWGRDPRRQPTLQEGDALIFNEPGRILRRAGHISGGIDYRPHCFSVVRTSHGGDFALLTSHGGGEERIRFAGGYQAEMVDALHAMPSDARYLLLHQFSAAARDARYAAQDATAREYATAFVEGRLKKRRKNNRVRVEIVHPSMMPAKKTAEAV